ncbi:MAG: hypothetical protein IJ740_03335 [Ruminococcus sp.]|nr:hypothetical protein [Ruminococcus sp.]
MDNTKELALESLKNDPEFSKVLEENEKFDIYFDKILSAENQYKSDNDIMSLIAFWEDLWSSEGVHNVSYKHAYCMRLGGNTMTEFIRAHLDESEKRLDKRITA